MIKQLLKARKTNKRIKEKDSNKEYWADLQNYRSSWRGRTEQIAKLISPGEKVLEFGCGEMILKDLLPDGCEYMGSDIVARDQDTLVMDLNKEIKYINEYHFNVIVFSGVLEYIFDLRELIAEVRRPYQCSIITSYADLENFPVGRRANGWVNDYTRKEFISLFRNNGFHVSYFVSWNKQIIYVFE